MIFLRQREATIVVVVLVIIHRSISLKVQQRRGLLDFQIKVSSRSGELFAAIQSPGQTSRYLAKPSIGGETRSDA